MKATAWSASAFGYTHRGFPLPVPEDLGNVFDLAINGQKVNRGQYLTTGHLCHGAVIILFRCQLSRKKRTDPILFCQNSDKSGVILVT
jgi:hypothetical protein